MLQHLSMCMAGLKSNCGGLLIKNGSKLFENVNSVDDKKMIDSLRVLLDMKTLAMEIKSSGSTLVASIQCKNFIEKARQIVPNLTEITDCNIMIS